MKRRAVLSVTDKTGLAQLGRGLHELGLELCASGGSAAALRDAGLPVTAIADITGQPEILGGRVKTLHPAVHAGILAAREEDLAGSGHEPVQVVAVNLYDFAGELAAGGDEGQLVEKIDIGGPTLLRAAAKNFARVWVLPDPSVYEAALHCMANGSEAEQLAMRKELAGQVFARTHSYDGLISRGLFAAAHALRYGENPHQSAHWQVEGGGGLDELGLALHGGKEPSYNNLLDVVATLKLAADLPGGGCAVIKHTNPCGAGTGGSPAEALERALACDPVSAFGGIVAFRDEVDDAAAAILAKRFVEVVLAPGYSDGAREALGRKKNLRWFTVDLERFVAATRGNSRQWGRLVLSQDEDEGFGELDAPRHAAGPEPGDEQLAAARLAWRVAKHVKSNAIVLAAPDRTLGIGAGQMSRVDSSRLAIEKARVAGLDITGCAAASDGFFPFADGLEQLADAGVRTVIQPGGSIRDEEVGAAADERGVTLLLTGTRHFRH